MFNVMFENNSVLFYKGTVELKSERLILRRFTTNDSSDMFNNLVNDPILLKQRQRILCRC